MRRLWIATLAVTFLCSSPAFSQVGGMASPTPGIAATSPLGMAPGALVPQTGIPLGATELASPGLIPVTNGIAGMAGYGTTCSASGSPTSGTSGTGTYDGGGMALGMGIGLPGSTATCTSPGNSASSTAATSSMTPSSVARPGIPLGSVEIGNAGISPLVTIPTPSASPSAFGTLSPIPSTTSTLGAPPATVGAPVELTTNGTGMPCGSVITSTPQTGC
jgi:hypothetical protein